MHLDRHVARPGAAELRERDAGMEQQGTQGAGPGLGEHLRGQHAQ